jgi:2-polyprenyl-3-methyl-5-hydroxy-6-metoxy-1,4-benzoquinol methylase
MIDKTYWNNLFINRNVILPPDNILIEKFQYFKKGSLLDIGCGDGRNALFFAERGYSVTCIDYSEIGLEKIKKLSERIKVDIKVKIVDLTKNDQILKLEKFDNIISIHSYINSKSIKLLIKKCNHLGIIVISTFIKESVDPDSSKSTISIPRNDIEIIKENGRILYEEITKDNRGELYNLIMENQ